MRLLRGFGSALVGFSFDEGEARAGCHTGPRRPGFANADDLLVSATQVFSACDGSVTLWRAGNVASEGMLVGRTPFIGEPCGYPPSHSRAHRGRTPASFRCRAEHGLPSRIGMARARCRWAMPGSEFFRPFTGYGWLGYWPSSKRSDYGLWKSLSQGMV
ncbi:hypothetical protein HRbin30_00562 [bacterium HR30]|nr:hypothetical protein HRbin30_00562 [bacterium HR30]